jgi:hypothetical protein
MCPLETPWRGLRNPGQLRPRHGSNRASEDTVRQIKLKLLATVPRPPGRRRRQLPSHLPREEIVHLPAGGDCVCPACLGEAADEPLDIEPVVFKVAGPIRPKFSAGHARQLCRLQPRRRPLRGATPASA